MSFSADVEHIWSPPEDLPKTLRTIFKDGACVVFADEEFTAAIPCTNGQATELADLMDAAVIDNDLRRYSALRDSLCGAMGYQRLSLLFKTEMDKQQRKEVLASAARRNN